MKRFLSRLMTCPSCRIHVKLEEVDCPHCGVALRSTDGAAHRTAAALALGLGVATLGSVELGACSAYGVPCTGHICGGFGGAGQSGASGNGGFGGQSEVGSGFPVSSSVTSSTTSTTGGAADAGDGEAACEDGGGDGGCIVSFR